MSEPTARIIFERLLIPNGVSLLEVTDSFVATLLSLLSVGLLPSSLPLTLFSFYHISHDVRFLPPRSSFLAFVALKGGAGRGELGPAGSKATAPEFPQTPFLLAVLMAASRRVATKTFR